jgi:hypothetical protein
MQSSLQILLRSINKVLPVIGGKTSVSSLDENSKNGEDLSRYLKCRSCNKTFDNLGDMQRHIMVVHHQKGDIP